jgi:hypothetical protein
MYIDKNVFNSIRAQALVKLNNNKDRPMSEATIEAETVLDVLKALEESSRPNYDEEDLINRI